MKDYFSDMEHGHDVRRVCQIALSYGCYIHPLEAEKLWDDYSDSMAAGWMCLPEDDDEAWALIEQRIYLRNSL